MRVQKVFHYPLLVLLLLVNACIQGSTYASNTPQEPMDLIVSTEWLSEHLGDPDLVVLDTTVLVQQDENGKFRKESQDTHQLLFLRNMAVSTFFSYN